MKREDIIALVAKEHGILISRDDPILALLAVHQVLVNYYVNQLGENFENMAQQLSQQLDEVQSRYSDQSRKLANEVVGDAIRSIAAAEQKLTASLGRQNSNHQWDAHKLARIEWLVIAALALGFGNLVLLFLEVLQ